MAFPVSIYMRGVARVGLLALLIAVVTRGAAAQTRPTRELAGSTLEDLTKNLAIR